MESEVVTFKLVDVTPALAREWLKRNVSNRPLRTGYVEALAAAFRRGEYMATHQGIAFSKQGDLMDGQHRLSAIAQQSEGQSFPMSVTLGLDREHAFKVIDIGERRTHADVLERDRREVEVARVIASIHTNLSSRSLTPLYVEPICERISAVHSDLMAFCGTAGRTFSAAPVRMAAVLTILDGGDADYVKLIYRSLITADFDTMPPAALALSRAYWNGQVKSGNRNDMICRCMKVFDPAKSNVGKIQIKDQHALMAKVRAIIATRIYGEATTAASRKPAAATPTRRQRASTFDAMARRLPIH